MTLYVEMQYLDPQGPACPHCTSFLLGGDHDEHGFRAFYCPTCHRRFIRVSVNYEGDRTKLEEMLEGKES